MNLNLYLLSFVFWKLETWYIDLPMIFVKIIADFKNNCNKIKLFDSKAFYWFWFFVSLKALFKVHKPLGGLPRGKIVFIY